MAGYKYNGVDIIELCEVASKSDGRAEAKIGTICFQDKYHGAGYGGIKVDSDQNVFSDTAHKLISYVSTFTYPAMGTTMDGHISTPFYSVGNCIDLPYKINGQTLKVAKKGYCPGFQEIAFCGYQSGLSSIILTKAPSRFSGKAQTPIGSLFISKNGGSTFEEILWSRNRNINALFIRVQGAGGGGGGASGGWISHNPGGGGGGGGHLFLSVDFGLLPKNANGEHGYLQFNLADGGAGGGGSTGNGGSGSAAGNTTAKSVTGPNSVEFTFTAYGGGGGGGGSGSGSTAGGGGSAGGTAFSNSTADLPSGFNVWQMGPGNAGALGRSAAACSGHLITSVPTYPVWIYNNAGGSVGSGNSPGGGGGASVSGIGGQGGDRMDGSGSAKDGKQGTGWGSGGGGGGANQHISLAGGTGAKGRPAAVWFYY